MSTSSNKNFKPEEHYLSNGIPVILQHLDGSVGTFHWWNLTGSTDEKPEEAGFAHFLEHMLFLGTDKFSIYKLGTIYQILLSWILFIHILEN